MKCPFCGFEESKVVNSRPADEGARIRRRRECLRCQKRFSTFETVETMPLIVIKKDGTRQAFDRDKLLRSLLRACDQRQVTLSTLERAADEIEYAISNSMEQEISTVLIGEMAMEKLRKIDEVAFVRFASVYRQFKDISTFKAELDRLLSEK